MIQLANLSTASDRVLATIANHVIAPELAAAAKVNPQVAHAYRDLVAALLEARDLEEAGGTAEEWAA